jgi:hypothetical protein
MEGKRGTRDRRLIVRRRARTPAVWHGVHHVGALRRLGRTWLAASGSGARAGVTASTMGHAALRNMHVSTTSAMAMCRRSTSGRDGDARAVGQQDAVAMCAPQRSAGDVRGHGRAQQRSSA